MFTHWNKQIYLKQQNEAIEEKKNLDEEAPMIDITNVYGFEKDDTIYFVNLDVVEIPYNFNGSKTITYLSTLTDIFNKKILYKGYSHKKITRDFIVKEEETERDSEIYNATITPIVELNPSLLSYENGKIPLSVLEQELHKLNKNNSRPFFLRKKYKNIK